MVDDLIYILSKNKKKEIESHARNMIENDKKRREVLSEYDEDITLKDKQNINSLDSDSNFRLSRIFKIIRELESEKVS